MQSNNQAHSPSSSSSPRCITTQAIDEQQDPSFEDGFVKIYDSSVPIEVRTGDIQSSIKSVGSLENVTVQIFQKGNELCPDEIKVQISSEDDLFFLYTHKVNNESYQEIQQKQKLVTSYAEYSGILQYMFNNAIQQPKSHLSVLVISPSGEARLDFIQNMQYKFFELLSCQFQLCPEDIVREQIIYRYNTLKQRNNYLQARIADFSAIIKNKNPSLLLQLNKHPSGGGSAPSSPKQQGCGIAQK